MLYFAFLFCFPALTYGDITPAGVQVTAFTTLGVPATGTAGTTGGDLVTASSVAPGNPFFAEQAFAQAANGGMSLFAMAATGVSPGGNVGEAQAFGAFEDALIFGVPTSGFVVLHGSGDGVITTSGDATAAGSVLFGGNGLAAYRYSLTGGAQVWTTPMIPFQDVGSLILFMEGELDARALGPNASTATLDYSHTFGNFSISQYDTNGVLVKSFIINPPATVPEPATLTLLGVGLVGAIGARRRRLRDI